MGKQYLNGVLYGTGEIIKFSPYIYSLEEREVGVHTNGKPLYEKTYRWTINDLHSSNIQSGNMYGEFWLDHVAYDEFWMFDTKIINKGTYWRIKSISSNTPHESIVIARSNIQIYQTINDGYPFVYFKTTDSSAYNDKNSLTFYYTIRYTKTTDTPGSGHYTTKGGEAHHYSTTEQIVGTWIDGKPLYEKVIHYGALPSQAEGYINYYNLNIANLDKVTNIHGYGVRTVNSTTTYFTLPFVPTTNVNMGIAFYVDNGVMTCAVGTDRSNIDAYLTIQYTKTTD